MAYEKKYAKKDLNACTFTGNLGQVKDLHYFDNGNAVLNFSIAVSDDYAKGEGNDKKIVEQTTWLDCSAYGKHAEGLDKVIRKWKSVTAQLKFKGAKTFDGKNGTGVSNKFDVIELHVAEWKTADDQDEEEDIEF